MLVTHQLQFIKSVDQIVIMDKSKIIADGAFDDLNVICFTKNMPNIMTKKFFIVLCENLNAVYGYICLPRFKSIVILVAENIDCDVPTDGQTDEYIYIRVPFSAVWLRNPRNFEI